MLHHTGRLDHAQGEMKPMEFQGAEKQSAGVGNGNVGDGNGNSNFGDNNGNHTWSSANGNANFGFGNNMNVGELNLSFLKGLEIKGSPFGAMTKNGPNRGNQKVKRSALGK